MTSRVWSTVGAALLLMVWTAGCSRKTTEQAPSSLGSDVGEWQVASELVQVSRPWERPTASVAQTRAEADRSLEQIRPIGSVGTDACVSCHKEQAASYALTSHSRAGRPAEQSGVTVNQGWRNERSGRQYEATRSDGVTSHSETIQVDEEVTVARQTAELDFEFGSGTHAHTYFFRDGSFACESPLTWYAESHRWDLSPGYDPLRRPSFDRVITTGCVYCHVGRIRVFNDNPNHFQIVESTIGCERCHGPGETHVARHRQPNEPTSNVPPSTGGEKPQEDESRPSVTDPDDVVNPALLSRQASEAICAQCHLQGAVLVLAPEADLWDFRPGESLSEHRTDYQLQATSDTFRIVGHTEQMHASPCYQASSTLTCITCHDPHRHGTSEDLRTHFQQACLACHADDSCSVDPVVRDERVGNDCSTCHMPKRPTNVTHAALHDHRIGVHRESFESAGLSIKAERLEAERLAVTNEPRVSDESALVSILDSTGVSQEEQERRWALATHHHYFNDRHKEIVSRDMKRAKTILMGLKRDGHSDLETDVALARDYFEAGMIGPAEQLATAILEKETGQRDAVINATDILAQIALQRQDNATAMRRYEQLVSMRRVAGDHFLLGICRINAGKTEEATVALLNALRIDPLFELAHEQLAVLFEHHNDRSRSTAHRNTLRQIRSLRQSLSQPGMGNTVQ